MLFDFKAGEWSELVKGRACFGGRATASISITCATDRTPLSCAFEWATASVDEVAGLKGIRQAGRLAGLDFSLTPDGAPLILRDIGTQEIYSLDWRE